MKKFKNIALIAAASAIILTGCKGTPDTGNSDGGNSASANGEVEIHNFIMPEVGEKIAVIKVKDFGEIKIKLFPEDAEKGVENFIGLAEKDYYDGLTFHRIIEGFMNQGGDPQGNGYGGSSIWGEKFEGGTDENLYHFSGAVAYANSGSTSTNGSQFYIVNTDDGEYNLGGEYRMDGSVYYYQTFEEAGVDLPENVQAMYDEKGGTPLLDGGYTVFGQVFEGMDVVRAMAEVETNPENDMPLTPVVMESVEIVEYTGE